METLYSLFFYVPESHLETVKMALFDLGVGRYEDYSHCSWQVLGEGQFKPLVNAKPFIGTIDEIEKVKEWRVEMLCSAHLKDLALSTLKKTHPYEEPAFGFIKLEL
jgi:hypothetical protein